MGWSLSVLREGWETECYYSGRGERRTITTQEGVGGGCNSKHYWLMELLLDLTNYFNCFFRLNFVCLNFSAEPRRFLFFCHAKAKLSRKHWTLIFIENIAFTILHCWVMRAPFESTCAPSVASRFPLCIHYVITKFIYLSFVINLIRRDHGISGPYPLT